MLAQLYVDEVLRDWREAEANRDVWLRHELTALPRRSHVRLLTRRLGETLIRAGVLLYDWGAATAVAARADQPP